MLECGKQNSLWHVLGVCNRHASCCGLQAREMIVKRAETMGINWNAEMEVLKKQE
jgi:hypothetical protein